MPVAQLKSELEARATESRRRLQKMRNIYNSIEKTVKESRGLDQIQSIKEELNREFAEFLSADPCDEEDAAVEEVEQEVVADEPMEDDKKEAAPNVVSLEVSPEETGQVAPANTDE